MRSLVHRQHQWRGREARRSRCCLSKMKALGERKRERNRQDKQVRKKVNKIVGSEKKEEEHDLLGIKECTSSHTLSQQQVNLRKVQQELEDYAGRVHHPVD